MRSSTRTRRAAVALCAAGAVLLLGACAGPAKPGSAAVVGTERVSDQQVADRAAEVLDVLGGKLPDGVSAAAEAALSLSKIALALALSRSHSRLVPVRAHSRPAFESCSTSPRMMYSPITQFLPVQRASSF